MESRKYPHRVKCGGKYYDPGEPVEVPETGRALEDSTGELEEDPEDRPRRGRRTIQ